MSRQLVLVKHSQPEIREGLPAREWRLSGEGKTRALRLAERLRSYRFDRLASSMEPKARETAEILAERFGLIPEIVEGLHEHERSTVPFLSKPEFDTAVLEFFRKSNTLVFGSETANEACERFTRAVDSFVDRRESDTPLIVSHGTVISLFVSRLTGESDFQIWSRLGLPGFVMLDLQSKELLALENII